MLKEFDERYIKGQYIFTQCQDNKTLFKKEVLFISKWPANSPDLNLIEHLLSDIKRIMKTYEMHSKDELLRIIYPQESFDRLVLSFRARLYTVIDYNGQFILDILRSGNDYLVSTVIPKRTDLLSLPEIIQHMIFWPKELSM